MKKLNLLLIYLTAFLALFGLSACQTLPFQNSGTSHNAGSTSQQQPAGNTDATQLLIGKSFNETMRPTDRKLAWNTLQYKANNESFAWVNDKTGFRFVMTPKRTRRSGDGAGVCRVFETRVYKGQLIDKSTSQACHDPQGNWRVRNARLTSK